MEVINRSDGTLIEKSPTPKLGKAKPSLMRLSVVTEERLQQLVDKRESDSDTLGTVK